MTSGDYFKSIRIVHLALMLGVVFFALCSILLQYIGFGGIGDEITNGLLIVVPVFAIIGIIASNLVFKKRIKEIDKQTSLLEKMNKYRSALLLKFALIEGPAFFIVVAYMLTGNYIFLGIAVILIVVFLVYIPTRGKLVNELELSKAESDLIYNSEAEIS